MNCQHTLVIRTVPSRASLYAPRHSTATAACAPQLPGPPCPVCRALADTCRSGVGCHRPGSLTMRRCTMPAAPCHDRPGLTDYPASCRCPATTEPDPQGTSTPSCPIHPVQAYRQPEQPRSTVPHQAHCDIAQLVCIGWRYPSAPLDTPHPVALSLHPSSEYDAWLTSRRSHLRPCLGARLRIEHCG